jgi:hypothetical protein
LALSSADQPHGCVGTAFFVGGLGRRLHGVRGLGLELGDGLGRHARGVAAGLAEGRALFGPNGTSLYVNGQLANRTALGDVMCGASLANAQIPDLALPWVVGASIYASQDVPNTRELPFLNGAIDNLRISGVERDFSSAF